MKKMLTKIIIVSLILSLHVPLTNAEQLTDSESMELVKKKLVNELEDSGLEDVEVDMLTPMEVQTKNLERDLEDIYEEKFEGVLKKPFDELVSQNREELDIDKEYLKKKEKEISKISEEDFEELEELIFSEEEEEEEEDLKIIEEMKEQLDFEHEDKKDSLIDSSDVIVQIKGKNESNEEFVLGFGFEIGDNVINISSETNNGKLTEYEIKLDTLLEDSFSATMKNLETNEKVDVELNDEEFKTSVFWIPALGAVVTVSMLEALAISVGLATLIYFAAQGLLSLKSGALWVAGKVANNNTKNKRYVHYEAMRTSNSIGLWVGPGRSKKKAISRLKRHLDTWSIGSVNARLIAKGASPTGRYRYNKAHKASKGKRTFTHYHPYELKSHAFYGSGKVW
ncbi:hypothetical protein C2W58_00747 [Bacillus pumilus]|nr:hypothetical protein [Bacillus pumilus]RAP09066.1 hypothetical protein C2W58_00747 [Bacillus pumilus]